MNRFKSWTLILVVALVSFVAGVVTTRMAVRHVVRTALHNPDLAWGRLEKRLAARLDLDLAQRAQAGHILERARSELAQWRRDNGPRVREIQRRAQSDLEAILTPAQRDRWVRVRDRHPLLGVSAEGSALEGGDGVD